MEAKTLYVFPACPNCHFTSGVIRSKYSKIEPTPAKQTGWWCAWCKKPFTAKAKEGK